MEQMTLWPITVELSAATKGETSRQSSKRSSASQNRKPPILKCLKKAGQLGGDTTMKWEDDGAWLGECMTRNTGESPNDDAVSRLSQILEVTPQEKYSLSAKACQGILRRAERRGKELPKLLKQVLLMQSSQDASYYRGCGARSGNEREVVFSPAVAHSLLAQGNDQYREDAATYLVQNMVARRLTPMECERLQGFPDHWTDIGEWRDSKGKLRKPSDSPRYKALGNSIALPFWDFLAKRISAQYLRPVTMGSLFDGIGGFPLVFERHNGKGTARWASEIEEFPIAVTKLRFGED